MRHVLIFLACALVSSLSWVQTLDTSPDQFVSHDTSSAPSPQAPYGPRPHQTRSRLYARAGLSFFEAYNPSQTHTVYAPGVTVALGVRMLQGKNAAVTVSFPITAGWNRQNVFFDIDLPAMIDLHLGCAAGNNQRSQVGFVMGAGMAYLYASNNRDRNTIHVGGLRYQAGISFGRRNHDARNLILASYGRSTTPSHNQIVGISFQFIMTNP